MNFGSRRPGSNHLPHEINQHDNSATGAARIKSYHNFAGHKVLTHYISAVMEKPMPPSSMSYRHLVHRNSTKEVYLKKLPLRPRNNSNRRHFYRHLNWNFLKKNCIKNLVLVRSWHDWLTIEDHVLIFYCK